MSKLIVFDKDWTLIKPVSGGTFAQHPHDQELLPGVAQKLKQLRADGWTMVIVSNQGGCAIFECDVLNLKPGMWIDLPTEDGQAEQYKIVESYDVAHGMICIDLNKERWNGKKYTFEPVTGKMMAAYKSIDEATEEMAFALKLTGIEAGFFCPDMKGEKFHIVFSDGSGGDATGYYRRDWRGLYRKPNPGMLYAIGVWAGIGDSDTLVMIGDREEDRLASAGFQFHWAKDFFEVTNA